MFVQPSGLDLQAVSKLVEEGKLRPVVDRIFPLEAVRRARDPRPVSESLSCFFKNLPLHDVISNLKLQ